MSQREWIEKDFYKELVSEVTDTDETKARKQVGKMLGDLLKEDVKRMKEVAALKIDDKALAGLKFSAALPRHLAVATLATRLADLDHAASVLAEPSRFER